MYIFEDVETMRFFLWLSRCTCLALLIWAAWHDWKDFELPVCLTVPAAVIAISGEGIFGNGWTYALLGAGVGFAVLKAAQVLARVRHKRECLGSGDALLMLALGALLGVKALPWALALAMLAALILARLSGKGKSDKLPFGPFLVGSTLSVVTIQWSF
ncbi:MAG: prepilin peptidase [Desulfovibrionaceae bacterium]|nr:prepilin peptidase [Desulfovibrionaceae bacterium]